MSEQALNISFDTQEEALAFNLNHIQSGQLTPSAAILLAREKEFSELSLCLDRDNLIGFWVAYPPNGVIPVPLTRDLWKELIHEKGKFWVDRELKKLTKQPSFHPYYILHIQDLIETLFDIALLIVLAILFLIAAILFFILILLIILFIVLILC